MFGGSQQSGVSDLLLGAGGFGGSLANGFGNDAVAVPGSSSSTNSGNANVASNSGGSTSGSGTSAFDLSDFPSLGGAANNGVVSGSGSGTSSLGANSGSGLAAALRQQQQQQQQLLAHQQMLQSSSGASKQPSLYRSAISSGSNGGANFTMATEDFPALPGAPPQTGGGGGNNGLSSTSSLLNNSSAQGFSSASTSVSRPQSNNVGQLYNGDGDNGNTNGNNNNNGAQMEGAGLLGGGGLGGLGVLGGLQQNNSNAQSSRGTAAGGGASAASGPAAGTALSGDFGLLGLLGVIRMTDADRNALALGSDLTMLGLNLGSSDHIYNTFASPWSDSSSSTKEPHYQLPTCYFMQPPALKTGHLSKFQLETLFYIFYALPKDVLQAYAAQELYSREWRYHADLKLWFKRAAPSDGLPAPASGSSQYLYFDISSWERCIFNGNMNQNVTSGFLTEDDVRVKFPSS